MLVNLYIKWNQLNNRTPFVSNTTLIKTIITNELKKIFPNADHNEKIYKGIAFRHDLMISTEVKMEERHSLNDSMIN